MDPSMLMIVRALHILLGALWLGTAVLLSFFLMPALRGVGLAGAPLVGRMAQRGLAGYITGISSLTALSGLWLYWRVTNGLQASVMSSPPVVVLGIGALGGLLATGLVIGVLVPAMKAMGAAMGALKQLPEGAERDAHLQRIDTLQRRFARVSKLVVALMLVALACMTLTHVL